LAFTFDSNNNLNVALVGSTPVVSENLASVGGANITLGAKTSANSLPVVLASDEANLPVVGASSGSQSATWTSANGAGTQIVVPCAGYATVTVNILSNGGTFNAGQLEFLAVNVNGTFSDITGMRQKLLTTQLYDASNLHTLATNERWNYAFNVSGFINFYIYILTPISGTGSVTVTATPVAVSSPGPTTVGQSDATKLNVTNIAATTTNSSTTWSSATPNFTFFTINCLGYNTVIFDVIPDAGSVSAGQFGVYGQMPGGVNGTTLNYMRQLNNFDQLYDSPRLTNFVGLVTARYIVNCAGYQTVSLFLTQPITGTLTVSLRGAASMAVTPGPTTVGQSDSSKHRVGAHGNTGSFKTYRATPAAGSQAVLTVPNGVKWLVKGGSCNFTTDANVANRNFFLAAKDASGNQLCQVMALSSTIAPLNQTASTASNYNFSPIFNFYMNAAVVTNYCLPFPELSLGPGMQIVTNTQNTQVGDVMIMTMNIIELPD